MALENPPFVDDFPIETSKYMGFPIAMFDYQRVVVDAGDVVYDRGRPGWFMQGWDNTILALLVMQVLFNFTLRCKYLLLLLLLLLPLLLSLYIYYTYNIYACILL